MLYLNKYIFHLTIYGLFKLITLFAILYIMFYHVQDWSVEITSGNRSQQTFLDSISFGISNSPWIGYHVG